MLSNFQSFVKLCKAKKAEFTSPIFLVHKLSHSLNFIQLMVIEKSAALTRYPLNRRADVTTSWSLGMVVCASLPQASGTGGPC